MKPGRFTRLARPVVTRLVRLAACLLVRVPASPPAGALPAFPGLPEALHDSFPLGLLLCTEDGAVERANAAFLRLSGYAQAELRAAGYAVLLPEPGHQVNAEGEARRDAQGCFPPFETELLHRDGMRVPVRLSGMHVSGPDGRARLWRVFEDCTARQRMVDALRHSESEARMLSAVASHTRGMVLICDREGRIEWVNEAFEVLTGYSRREVMGRRPAQLLLAPRGTQGPGAAPAVLAELRGRLAQRESFTTELALFGKEDRAYWVALECTPVFDHAGELERYVAIARDITATRNMHQALAQSEGRFRDLTDLSSDFFWEMDEQFRFIEMTETGSSPGAGQNSLGRTPWENPMSLVDAQTWAQHRLTLAAHLPFADFENPILTSEGRVVWRSISGKPLFGPDGRFLGYRGVGRDISARKESEELIQESKRMYRRVVEGVRDIIFQADAQGHFVFLNRAWTEATGFGVEEVIGESLFNYLHEEDRADARRMVQAALASQQEFLETTARVRARDGSFRWFEARIQFYTDAEGEFIAVGTLHDVTRERAMLMEQRNAEAALRVAQERYQRALDAANDGIWERDLKSGRTFFSARFKELFGFGDHDFPEERAFLLSRAHPDDRDGFERAIERMQTSRARSVIELRARRRDGTYRWFRLRSTVAFDDAGTPLLASGTVSDIHEARLAEDELKRHRDDLAGLVAERTASAVAAREEAEQAREAAEAANRSKSEFLANMSHELRTPMHAILSFASFGVDKAQFGERAKLLHYFANIQKSGSRLLTLLNDLLDLSKLEAGKMEMRLRPVSMAELLAEATAEAEALAKSCEVSLRMQVPAALPQAMLDGARVLQVIRNLLSNAIKFSPAGAGVLLILEATQMRVAVGQGAALRPALELRVIDGGIGIPEGELEAVFDKFVQSSKTKTGAGGTGLGLAICREIVVAHGGTIEARNNAAPLRGACFVVRLPMHGQELLPGAAEARAQVSAPSADIPGRKG
jgi:PAS domain S-box-containing protein